MKTENLFKFDGFDWDKGNEVKNWNKHRVSKREAEQVFFNRPLLISPDQRHSKEEQRFGCYGRTADDRKLFVSFTVRSNKIRVISARDQNKKEREVYVKKAQKVA